MWPKALAQLVELAPHIVRMVPIADMFFQSKSAESEANRKAMEQMAEGLRGDLGQVTASHVGLYRQLNDQSEKLGTIAVDVRAARQTLEAVEARMHRSEEQLRYMKGLLALTFGLVVGLLVFVIVMTFHLLVMKHA